MRKESLRTQCAPLTLRRSRWGKFLQKDPAGFYLTQGGVKTAIFERTLRVGGGMLLSGRKVAQLIIKELKG